MIDPRTIPVRFTALKAISMSPAHYRHACQRIGRKSTLPLRLGIGTHALTFGTPAVIVYRGGEYTNKKGKTKTYSDVKNGECWEDFKSKHADKVILSEAEYLAAEAMANALRSDPLAAPLLFGEGVRHELEVEWKFGGRACAGRVDAIGPVAIVDLKSARSAEPSRFTRDGRWRNYHAQVAWYADGCEAAGIGPRKPYIVAIESGAPNPVVTMSLTPAAMEHGRSTYRGWLERLKVCEESNEWPGYAQSIVDFDVPDDSPFSLVIDGDEEEVA